MHDIAAADARPGLSCGAQPSGAESVLTWGIHSRGLLVFSILVASSISRPRPAWPGGWRRSPILAVTFSWTWQACGFVTAPG